MNGKIIHTWVFNQTDHSSIVISSSKPHPNFVTSTLVFIVAVATVKLFFNKFKYKCTLPGPLPLPLIGNGLLLVGGPAKLLVTISRMLDEYRGFFGLWIGPKLHVFISRPEDLEIFCTDYRLINKSDHYRYVTPTLGGGIFSSNGTEWKNGRKIIMPTLRPAALKSLMPNFTRHTKVMIEVLKKEEKGEPFDIFPYFRNCAYDMIYETVLGGQCNSQISHVHALDLTEEAMDYMYQRAFKLWYQWDPLYKLLPVGRRLFKICAQLNNFNLGEILRSLEKEEVQNSQLLVRVLSEKLGDQKDLIRGHVVTMLVTGYDTISGTLGFIMLMLGMHQDIQQKVYEEVAEIKKHLNGRDLESEDLHEYIYLERVIKETLRIFPVGPFLFRYAADDIKFGNFVVPKGSSIACTMIHTHRNPEIYPDPMKFNPDNFLPEKVAQRHPYSFIPFSAGPRGCVGVKYGMMAMKVMISELVYQYKISCDMQMSDIKLKPEITLKSDGGYPIRIVNRH